MELREFPADPEGQKHRQREERVKGTGDRVIINAFITSDLYLDGITTDNQHCRGTTALIQCTVVHHSFISWDEASAALSDAQSTK